LATMAIVLDAEYLSSLNSLLLMPSHFLGILFQSQPV
jgi:hypothetical protein